RRLRFHVFHGAYCAGCNAVDVVRTSRQGPAESLTWRLFCAHFYIGLLYDATGAKRLPWSTSTRRRTTTKSTTTCGTSPCCTAIGCAESLSINTDMSSAAEATSSSINACSRTVRGY